MEDSLYREIILEHWQHPQNYGVLPNADIDVERQNPLCGDMIRLMITLKEQRVYAVMFTGKGCVISQASASMFTEVIKEKTIEEMKQLREQDVLDTLSLPLTPARMKCALLIFHALRQVP